TPRRRHDRPAPPGAPLLSDGGRHWQGPETQARRTSVYSRRLVLAGRWASQRILVTGKLADGSLRDVDAGSGRRGEHTGQHRRQEAEIARHGEGRARDARVDGTIVPSAAGGSLAFLPGPALRG